jgi:hypothetical protein
MDEVSVMKSWKWFGVLVLGATLAMGCGGDDDDDGDKDAPTEEGEAGDNGSNPDAGTGLPELPEGAVACGKTTCELEEGETATLCCFDEFSAKCGMKQGMTGNACVMRVMSDNRCPSVAVAGGMFTLPSCCTADNMCGINAGVFTGGTSCTELGMAAMDPRGMGMITFPAPKACDE